MTTHKYPAVLPPQRQEAIEEFVNRLRNDLIQTEVNAAEWERQAGQFKASADRLRAELDQARDEIAKYRWREMHYTVNADETAFYRLGEAIWLRNHATDSQRSAMLKSRDDAVVARSAADREVGVLTGERDELRRQLDQESNARLSLERLLGEAHAAMAVGEEAG